MFLQYLFLNAIPKHFMFLNLPKFQAMHQLGHDILRCNFPVVPLQNTVRAEMYPTKTQRPCSHYKWQLHVSTTKQPSSGCLCEKCNRICYTAAYIHLKMISGRRCLGITYSGIRLLHGKSVHSIKGNV